MPTHAPVEPSSHITGGLASDQDDLLDQVICSGVGNQVRV
eukprot:CAMPEP_0184340144 /NCGR_PEP_ID=MMETSP1089-20130417/8820_1 /TAXON_ID=38269 ORGANISM="Gloeochaete wittrockiana, Strain SAG46.84" /NCGR_SAMPLE_ID=MMETSP1089 /ASSEMBLY_ACC=CAM_ASM_000445 /LENGTH=39 /DNA_ID= /DNA_START= /DNA_END= /DNA_ORIENTATION=